jgi:hypothetical protein
MYLFLALVFPITQNNYCSADKFNQHEPLTIYTRY